MDRYTDTVQNEVGNAVFGASVLIINQATNLPATIWGNSAGTAPLANPLTTDRLGKFSFCAANGIYSARVSIGGIVKGEQRDIDLNDNSGSAAALPVASSSTLGAVKIGPGLTIDEDGLLRVVASSGTGTVNSVNMVEADMGGDVALVTDNIPEPQSNPANRYFTEPRVRMTSLEGFSTLSNADITAADGIVAAFGKAQAQLNDRIKTTAKDTLNGIVGLTGYAINIKNAAGNVLSGIASAATVARTWTFPDKSGTVALTSDINNFPPTLHVRDQKPSGTDGGDGVIGNSRRTLNTVTMNTISGASLSGDQVILPAGTYRVRGSAPMAGSAATKHQAFLTGPNNNSTYITGTCAYIGNAFTSRSEINGYVVLASPSILEVRQYRSTAQAGYGFGVSTGVGIEVFTEIIFEKVA